MKDSSASRLPKTSFQVPGFFFKAVTSGSGTGPLNSLVDSGE